MRSPVILAPIRVVVMTTGADGGFQVDYGLLAEAAAAPGTSATLAAYNHHRYGLAPGPTGLENASEVSGIGTGVGEKMLWGSRSCSYFNSPALTLFASPRASRLPWRPTLE
jgi:hypothetical protein